MSASKSEAERLKAEGNALFVKNSFVDAYKKYTEALKYDPVNAILFCNRAACSLGLNRYLDAYADAKKATELDPGYAKAWGRLGAARTGLSRLGEAVEAWKRAIAALPTQKLTPAEQKQKDQYTSELATATAKLEDLKSHPDRALYFVRSNIENDLPWHRALDMIPALTAERRWRSSAWVVSHAYTDWNTAMGWMRQGKFTQMSDRWGYIGRIGVIEGLTNALLSDSRVFHISDANFVDMYNKQATFEALKLNAWTDNSSREIMEQAPKRLRAEGWDSVRPALSITVRGWIMRAFIEEKLKKNIETALDFYTSAYEVLQWGRELWKDVPDQDRGAIFQSTFIRGVSCLRLDAFMEAYQTNPGENSKYPLTELLAGANALLEELGAVTEIPSEHMESPGFWLSFYMYPAGQAHALRGFYYHNAGRLLREKEKKITEEICDLYRDASREYAEAAMNYYPADDENHVWYLHCAVNTAFDGGAPVSYLLRILDRMNDTIPAMKVIWEHSANATGGIDAGLESDMKLRKDLMHGIENGEITNEMAIRPGTLQP